MYTLTFRAITQIGFLILANAHVLKCSNQGHSFESKLLRKTTRLKKRIKGKGSFNFTCKSFYFELSTSICHIVW